MLFHPSHPGEVLKDYLGDNDGEGGVQALGSDAAKSLPDTERPRRYFSGDEACAWQRQCRTRP